MSKGNSKKGDSEHEITETLVIEALRKNKGSILGSANDLGILSGEFRNLLKQYPEARRVLCYERDQFNSELLSMAIKALDKAAERGEKWALKLKKG